MSEPETIALDKTKQKEVTRQTRRIKRAIKAGKITLKEARQQKTKLLEEARGLIYIAHLPHGFYEDELTQYFTQFGQVTNCKVCRSRLTGNSKGYGYVEFQNREVAKIAAETMNNYLMFKKRIVAEFVPFDKRPKALFVGKGNTPENYSALRRRQRTNHGRNTKIDDAKHVKKSKSVMTRLQQKMEKLKRVGIDYDIKPVDVPAQLIK